MTPPEFQKLLEEISACFPMVGEWIRKQTPAVFAKWRVTLSTTDPHTAIEVVNDWYNATANPLREPTSWQEIPTMIRREVYGKANKPEENWRTPKGYYRPSQDMVLMPYLDLIRANAKQFKAKIIDDAEYKNRTQDLLKQFDDGVADPVSPLEAW